MSAPEEETNPYELLNVKTESTEQEIRTAYRQRSLKVHPDRNPNNPDAARKFHELNQAYELLLDPLRRLALDAKLRIKQARAERFKSYDNKRKNLVEELEERERAFKKARMEKQKEEVETWRETERIKEEGKRLREQKEKEMWEKLHPKQEEMVVEHEEDEDAPPPMDPLDTTIRLKYPLKTYPNLTTPSSIATFLSRFGATDESSIVLSSSIKHKTDADKSAKAPKTGSALVPFKQIGDAFAAVCASGRKDLGMDGIKITWVNGKEPQVLAWLKRMGKLGTPSASTPTPAKQGAATPPKEGGIKAELPQNQSRNSSDGPFSSFPSTFPETFPTPEPTTKPVAPGIDYESLTLMRMRQAERERLEREILEQEANE
ncbi:DnaJ-domain-containing protein [Pholiota conissans]|uniref:DnaJ-domain-containing protein n=1 Tax=Pholiota conissans TaxID=109636 RepID=A0A9P5ZDC4_9AGAR|nr:DnaJ-domain-containing protein [Pholiota conissans]